MDISRREFLKGLGSAGLGAFVAPGLKLFSFDTIDVENPLASYPTRDWERIYRDQYRYDSVFSWVCSPNDTHACRVLAYVRNGIITRMGSEYDHETYSDIYGNMATASWNPRQCAKGFTFHQVVYGPYRLKYPLIRKGWKAWADDGFPTLNHELRTRYKFDVRGEDQLVKIGWDEVFTYIAKAYQALAVTYSGDEGARILLDQGYPPEMVKEMNGAGTMTFKFRGGMGLLGVFGKYGAYRLNNAMSLLDHHVRGVPPEEAKGGRNWSNYTWHGDQAPGHPWVHGLQTADCDLNDLRSSKLIIMDGKNLIENKITDSHWFVECMERGARIVTITPEYGALATKSDYWIPVRPQTDAALFLGVAKVLIDNKWYDEGFVKAFTDLPLLVRTDNLRRLRASEIFPDYQNALSPDGPSFKIQNLTIEQYEKLGDFVIWDLETNTFQAITRDDVGEIMKKKGLNPALEGRFNVRIGEKEIEVMPLFELYKSYHLKDYELDAVCEITGAPKELILRLVEDIFTIKPAAIHQGEGINHWFHATEMNRAAYLPIILTGNIGKPGAGCFTWAGNYKAANFQGSPWTGPGFKGWVAEDPFNSNLYTEAHGKDVKIKGYCKDEEPAYWNHGDVPLIVNTPEDGRKVFTGKTHMPTPTKAIFFNNVNLFNNAKHAYAMFKNVNPKIDMIIGVDIQMTSSVEYSDITLPANSWVEFEGLEVTSSCSNPFLQVWKGGIEPVFDSKDDLTILAGIAQKTG